MHLVGNPVLLKELSLWFGGQGVRSEMLKTMKSLNGTQLDQLETKLESWVRHCKAEHSAPETVSTPAPVAGVHVSPLAPPVQQNTGPAPVAVPVHALAHSMLKHMQHQ